MTLPAKLRVCPIVCVKKSSIANKKVVFNIIFKYNDCGFCLALKGKGVHEFRERFELNDLPLLASQFKRMAQELPGLSCFWMNSTIRSCLKENHAFLC